MNRILALLFFVYILQHVEGRKGRYQWGNDTECKRTFNDTSGSVSQDDFSDADSCDSLSIRVLAGEPMTLSFDDFDLVSGTQEFCFTISKKPIKEKKGRKGKKKKCGKKGGKRGGKGKGGGGKANKFGDLRMGPGALEKKKRRLARTIQKLERMEEKEDRLEAKLERLEGDPNKADRYDRVSSRLDRLLNRIESLEERMERLEDEIAELEGETEDSEEDDESTDASDDVSDSEEDDESTDASDDVSDDTDDSSTEDSNGDETADPTRKRRGAGGRKKKKGKKGKGKTFCGTDTPSDMEFSRGVAYLKLKRKEADPCDKTKPGDDEASASVTDVEYSFSWTPVEA